MKNIINSKFFSKLIFFLIVLVLAKIIWTIISIQFLPKSGIEYSKQSKLKAFYYPIRLSNSKKVKPKIINKAPVKTRVKVAPKKLIGDMKGYKLLALYQTNELLVVTVAKGAKTKVLSIGEIFNGFKLKSAGREKSTWREKSTMRDYALFNKGSKDFKIFFKNIKPAKSKPTTIKNKKISAVSPPALKKKGIVATDDGETKVVSKGLLSSYTKDIDKVWKDIGIGEHKVNGVLTGFKVNFIKRNSDFEKLGLKRGDILTSINGQELDSYNAAFSFYKEMDSIENLTLSIKRNNQNMELEYEIQ